MTEFASWSQTPAGLLANGGWDPSDRAVELAEREAQHARDRAEFEARLAANPEWSASRKLQEALAARGWTGRWVDVGPSRPPELAAMDAGALAAQTRRGTWGPDGHGGMEPTNDVAAQIEQATRERYEAAKLREQAAGLRLPPGLEAL